MPDETKDKYIAELLGDPFCPATIVAMIIADHYGTMDFLNYDYATIFLDLKEIAPRINRTVKEKIKAIINLYTTDLFYLDWMSFQSICWTFNDKIPIFTVPTPMQVHEIAWGVTEADILDPYEIQKIEDDITYTKEIKRYVNETMIYQGFYEAPKELRIFGFSIMRTLPEFEKTHEVKSIQAGKLEIVTAYVNEKRNKIKIISDKIKSFK